MKRLKNYLVFITIIKSLELHLISKIKKRIRSLNISLNPGYILAYWAKGRVINNWGDALNPVLIQHLSGKKPIYFNSVKNYTDKPVYSVIGSYLGNEIPAKNLHFWGSGFWRDVDEPQRNNAVYHAVRGPLSRMKLIKAGIECHEVYGDPAILYPLFYRPTVNKKYELGVIPHFRDKQSQHMDLFKRDDVLIIDIEGGIQKVVDQILQCQKIASSSLHGIIAADAYGIPSLWIQFDDHSINDNFKFNDYLASVKRNSQALEIDEKCTYKIVMDSFIEEKPELDVEALIRACPFISKKVLDKMKPDTIFK